MLKIAKGLVLLTAACGIVLADAFGPDLVAPFVASHTGEKMFADIFSRVDRTHKTSQINFLIVVDDGPGSAMVSGPMSRMQADAEMKLYVDANPTLMVEDGHGGYIDVNTREPMQNLLLAHDPVEGMTAVASPNRSVTANLIADRWPTK